MEQVMYRLIYKSHHPTALDWQEVQELLHKSEDYNNSKEITGVLLATQHHFLQILEGRYEVVNDLFMKIVKDPRHDNIQLISFNIIDARLFPGWGMRGLGVLNFNQELSRRLIKTYGEEKGELRFPLEEWRVLALVHELEMVSNPPQWKQID